MSIEIEQLSAQGSDAPPLSRFEEIAQVTRAWHLAELGFEDLVDSPEATATAVADQTYRRKMTWLARRDGQAVGTAYLALPLRDNLTLAEGDLTVLPDAQAPDEAADALWAAMLTSVRAAGRRTVQLWSAHASPAAGTAATWLVPATGVGRVPRDAQAERLMRWGFTLEQAERHSVLDVQRHQGTWDALEEQASEHSSDYETLTWVGQIPAEQHAAMAELMSRMSVDVPSGELDLEEEAWDADRVASQEQMALRRHRLRLTTVARHRTSGALAAYTYLDAPRDHPQVAYQEDTLVHGEHRGHRLGMLIKVRTLRALQRERPQVRRVHTWNAGENRHMLAINEALGFAATSHEGAWQLRLPPAQS